MARYDYKCTKCEHVFEVMKAMKDSDTPEQCPKCNEPAKKVYLKASTFRVK